jgi:MinD superfamily P-loop ATPase
MKELIVLSGKGGTGKTSLTAAFAYLAEQKVLCDADVDAADLHLLAAPKIERKENFQSGHTAVIATDRCTGCGLCREMCRWDAISDDFLIDSIECEGCGVCVDFCPEKAIDFPINTCGQWYISNTRFGPMVHAHLGIAEENSGKLVTLVRQQAKKLAGDKQLELILTDGPPGVGCPVIASLGGASAVLVVTEPTVSGCHDTERVLDLTKHFNVPTMLCINKFDLNPEMTRDIERSAVNNSVTLVGRIPFDLLFTKAMVQAQTIFEYDGKSKVCAAMKATWEKVSDYLTRGCPQT